MTTLEKIIRFRHTIVSDTPAVGVILDFDGWQMLRVLRTTPVVDFVWIDMEHGTVDLAAAYKAVDTLAAMPVTPLVRASSTSPETLKRTVDLGVGGIVLPHVDTADQAREALSHCLYPPIGVRSVGPNAAANQWQVSGPEYLKQANENLLIVVQIEHVDALAEIDSICAIDRVDVIFIGRFDLSGSLGRPGDVEHPDVVDAENRVVAAARTAGKPVGTIATKPDVFERTVKAGFNLIVTTSLMNFAVMGIQRFFQEGRA